MENVTIQYVNQRNGNKPASVKLTDGRYVTIPDNALGMFQQNMSGGMVLHQDQKGFWHCDAWNGMPMPQQNQRRPQQQFSPQQQNNTQDVPLKDKLILRSSIAKSCIEAGKTPADADAWWNWMTGKKPTQLQPQANYGVQNDVPMEMPSDDMPF